ncbi:LysR family transcriptional regulator [Trinickia acidisoli]|uniref:LysR family transcriptional regulator n=1 Tax=Trinickia acidisoli TaxID=2767482 RepID=UPI001A8C2F15|nr:LysR family transcriptional regulator [Trinickia acidisoli]
MKKNLTTKPEPLGGLSAFRAVAEAGSFRSASDVLGISASAVSQSVHALEARLGVALFNRTSRTVSLSEAGRFLLEHVDPSLARIEAAMQRLREGDGEPSGLLRINLSRLANTLFVKPRLGEFLERYPRVDLDLYTDDTLADIVGGGFDAGIRPGHHLAQDMIALPLDRGQRRAVVATPSYLKRHGVPHTLADLAQHDCIRFRLPGTGRLYPWQFTERGKALQIDVTGRLVFVDDDLCRDAVRAGFGLAQQFEAAIAEDLAARRLVPVLETHAAPLIGFYIYFPKRDYLPLKLRAFIDFLREPLIASTGDGRVRAKTAKTASTHARTPARTR